MRSVALVLALAVAGVAFAGDDAPISPAVLGDEKRKSEDDKKRQAMRRNLVKIAGEFGAKDTVSLVNRIAKGQKLSLSLEGKSGENAPGQATKLLQDYFDSVQTASVTTDGKGVTIEETVGSFPVTLRKKGAEKDLAKHLTVTIGNSAPYPLIKLSVE